MKKFAALMIALILALSCFAVAERKRATPSASPSSPNTALWTTAAKASSPALPKKASSKARTSPSNTRTPRPTPAWPRPSPPTSSPMATISSAPSPPPSPCAPTTPRRTRSPSSTPPCPPPRRPALPTAATSPAPATNCLWPSSLRPSAPCCRRRRNIGILYTVGEANSLVQLESYKELAGDYGFTIVESGVTSGADIALALPQLLPQVDC